MNRVYQYKQIYNNGIPKSIDISSLQTGNYILLVQQGDRIQYLKFTKE
jgi:hypothetical protein